jgi:hypothetical protein
MRGYSVLGCGVMTLGHFRMEDGSLSTTLWVTFLYLPVIPLARWKVLYRGECSMMTPKEDPAFLFHKIERLPLDWWQIAQTYARRILVWLIVIAPAFGLPLLLPPGGGGPVLIALAIAAFCAPFGAMLLSHHYQRRFLEESSGPDTRGRNILHDFWCQ